MFRSSPILTLSHRTTVERFIMVVFALVVCAMVSGCERFVSVGTDIVGPDPARAMSFSGRVVAVADGDTLTVLDARNARHTIRLAEIDAPELGQPWGVRAKDALSDLVLDKSVSIQQTDTDRYGRIVGRVFADGVDVNRTMVERGAAWAFRQYLTDASLIDTERRAIRDRAGLWASGDANVVPPWDWRSGVRDAGRGSTPASAQPPRPFFSAPPPDATQSLTTTEVLTCAGKRVCREMTSCAEAHFYLRQCGVSSLDGNSDGEPCEVLCGTARR